MDLNELKGRVLKVNLARPMKATMNPQDNRASAFSLFIYFLLYFLWLTVLSFLISVLSSSNCTFGSLLGVVQFGSRRSG
jgi:IS4 transposase